MSTVDARDGVIMCYRVQVSSRHPHVAARILSLLRSSRHNEARLDENEYDLYECSDEVAFISLSKHDPLQTHIEYEADDPQRTHINFIKALKRFPDTSVRVLAEQAV